MTVAFLILALCCLLTRVTITQNRRFHPSWEMETEMEIDLLGNPVKMRSNLPNIAPCRNSMECSSGCCVQFRKNRMCLARAEYGERCTVDQVKGGVFDQYCPCKNSSFVCDTVSPEPSCQYVLLFNFNGLGPHL
ncbi:uncharacterized protein LOC111640541 [Centruroides sculpturatus]|uniref:uncharacterized protein LOC111640541 n=1 Tax=Centruroides sculpturatus TaxID=218467 RepID=UPI000C6D372A|nr:uncharacterized protein LOC111640541 [Centruroides sculpturatus]